MKKFSVMIKASPKDNPNQVGEILRSKFFAEGYGCYSCFDWAKDVKPLPFEYVECDSDIEEEYRMTYACAELTTDDTVVKCRYFWDGDGELQFIFPDGSCLINDDCKKDYRWKYYARITDWTDHEDY